MLERFKDYINANNLIRQESKVLLAVSGGIDSVIMTELFKLSGLDFSIAHCNFHLRGVESNEDALFVEALSKEAKVEFHLTDFDTTGYAAENKLSIQMAARQLRVNWLEAIVKQYGYQSYATAHHQDDQIETFMINLLRGCGISGLHGILPKKGLLIHPMLYTNRAEIEAFARENNILFREDSSNHKNDYLRNKIRHNLIPVLMKIEPGFQKIFTENIERFQQVEDIYQQQIQLVNSKLVTKEKDRLLISVTALLALNSAESYLFEIVSDYGFNFYQVKDIVLSLNKQSGKKYFSKSHILVKDRDYLILDKKMSESELMEYTIESKISCINDPINLEFKNCTNDPAIFYNKNKNLAFLDRDKLKFPLKIRKWEKGDSFYPLGMKGKKLISDYLVDNKISIADKKKIWLLISDGQIVWIIGQRMDNRYRISAETKNVICLKFNK